MNLLYFLLDKFNDDKDRDRETFASNFFKQKKKYRGNSEQEMLILNVILDIHKYAFGNVYKRFEITR